MGLAPEEQAANCAGHQHRAKSEHESKGDVAAKRETKSMKGCITFHDRILPYFLPSRNRTEKHYENQCGKTAPLTILLLLEII